MSQTVQCLTDNKGKKKAVVLPTGEYEELPEDLHDLAVVADRRNEPRESLESVRKRLVRLGKFGG